MASAWQMSGSVPVKHCAVRVGQDAEDLVDVLSDESRHARIRTQIFLARGLVRDSAEPDHCLLPAPPG